VDQHHQEELRDWAERLAAATNAERRAMGRAILMLLAQIDELQAQLGAASSPVAPAHPGAQHPRPLTSTTAVEAGTRDRRDRRIPPEIPEVVSMRSDKPHPVADTDPISLRQRLRRAAHRNREPR
jgi:hypothetical protein